MKIIEIPALPTSDNVLRSGQDVGWIRKKYANHRDQWILVLKSYAKNAGLKLCVKVKRLILITFHVRQKRGRLPDPWNLASKGFIDALVWSGIIEDDSTKWCRIEATVIRSNEDKTVIEVIDENNDRKRT